MNKKEAYTILTRVHEELKDRQLEDLEKDVKAVIDGYFYESNIIPKDLFKEALKMLKPLPKKLEDLKFYNNEETWEHTFLVKDGKAHFGSGMYYISIPVCIPEGLYLRDLRKIDIPHDYVSLREVVREFEAFYSTYSGRVELHNIDVLNVPINKISEVTLVGINCHDNGAINFKFITRVLDFFQKALLKHPSDDHIYFRYSREPLKWETMAFKNEHIELITVSLSEAYLPKKGK